MSTTEGAVEIIKRWVTEKKADEPCLCGGTKWIVASNHATLAPHYSEKVGDVSGVPCVIMACDNCGFVRMFAVMAIPPLREPMGFTGGKEG